MPNKTPLIFYLLVGVLLTGCGTTNAVDSGLPSRTSDISSSESALAAICPVTQPVWVKPPDDPAIQGSAEYGYYFVNQDHSMWASAWWTEAEGHSLLAIKAVKMGWFRPEGAALKITGQRLDGQAPPLEAHVPCCYPTRFQASGLVFPTEGCWEVKAKAADSELSFVVRVEPDSTQVAPDVTAKVTSLTAVTATPQGEAFEINDVRFVSRQVNVKSSESVAVAAADFDGDGHLDLVISGEPQLTLFRGDGQGGLISYGHVPGGEQPVDFALVDLDEDRDVDIVVANHDTDYLTILLGNGDGGFQPAPGSPLKIDVSPHPHAVRAADLDADGHVDLVVDHREAQGLLILRGLGAGRFESTGTLVDVGGDPYRGMAVGDVNGDSKLDLVTPNPGEVGVLFNASRGRIAFERASPVAAEAPFAVEVGDFNGDDKLDLVAASGEGSPLVELFLGDGTGEFQKASDSPFQLAPGGKNIAVGDFNDDGIDDAAVACWQASDVLVLLGGRDAIRTGTLPGGEHPWGLAVADLNEDGRDDLVIADDALPRAVLYLSLDP